MTWRRPNANFARRQPNYDAACFHAQQCAEQYLKAFLQDGRVSFPKTHSLIDLLHLALPIEPGLVFHRDALIRLDRYAVRYRYPGESADKDEARQALAAIKVVRAFVRHQMGLPT